MRGNDVIMKSVRYVLGSKPDPSKQVKVNVTWLTLFIFIIIYLKLQKGFLPGGSGHLLCCHVD
jgi:hypothetical protein